MPQTSIQTDFAPALEGAQWGSEHSYKRSMVNESATECKFGHMLAKGVADDGAKPMSDLTDVPVGILCRDHAYSDPHELGDDGLKQHVTMSVMEKGTIWVRVSEAVTPADPPRYSEVEGTFLTTAAAGVTSDLSGFARFIKSAGAGELVPLQFDFINRELRADD